MILHIPFAVKMVFVTAEGLLHTMWIGHTDGEMWGGKEMANYYIHVGSVTNAMRGKQLLSEQGVQSYLHRSSKPAEGEGCGYSLLVTDNLSKAEQILKSKGVRVIRITNAM